MTDLLHNALEALQRLPPERQDYITEPSWPWPMMANPKRSIHMICQLFRRLAQIERGEFASDEEVQALLRRLEE